MEDFKTPEVNILHESEVSFFPTALRWGLISAGISIVYALISNILGIAASQTALNSVIGLGIIGIISYLCIKAHREELGGFISFGRGFLVAFVALMISSVISSIFNFIYINYIDPSAMEVILQSTESMMSGFGMSEDQIEEAVEQTRKSMESPISILTGLIAMSLFSAIFAAIFGGIMKNERPAGY